jgi:hypothetical protein
MSDEITEITDVLDDKVTPFCITTLMFIMCACTHLVSQNLSISMENDHSLAEK